MARSKRRTVGRRHFQQLKKIRTADHISDDGAIDLNHSDVGENFAEELEQSKTNEMKLETDGTDDDDNNSKEEGKEEKAKRRR
eukprot:5652070-Ditylum_brightwellii.AAC.1